MIACTVGQVKSCKLKLTISLSTTIINLQCHGQHCIRSELAGASYPAPAGKPLGSRSCIPGVQGFEPVCKTHVPNGSPAVLAANLDESL